MLSVPFTMATSMWKAKVFFVLSYFSSDVWRENSKPVLSFTRFLVVVIKREVLNSNHWLWFVSKMNRFTWNKLVDVSFCSTYKNIISRGIFALMQHPTPVTHECHCMLVVDVSTHCLYVKYVSFLYICAVRVATREWLFTSLLHVEYTCNNLCIVRKKVMPIFSWINK